MYKKLSIILIVFVLSFWFWFVVKGWVTGDAIFGITSLWLKPLIFLILLSAIVGMGFLLLAKESFATRWALSWIMGLSYLLVFGFSLLNLGAVGAIVLINIYAISITKIEINERIRLNVGLALRRGMPAIIVPLLIASSFAYFQALRIDPAELEQKHITISEAIEHTANYVMGFETVEEKLAQQDLLKKDITDNIFDWVRDTFYEYTDKYQKYMPPVFAFGLFLILWGLSFLFVYASLGVALGLFYILKRIGFVKIEEIDVKAERLIL
ncbi:MAG: hypothetical protein ABH833_01750 [Parcubacteria group bacterium]